MLYIWKLKSFQNWYKAQSEAGNRIDDAELLYSFRPGFKDFIFMFVLRANIYIKSEDRNKTNEFVLSRPDISTVLLWKREKSFEDSEVVLIKEFRTPSTSSDGFVRELVGGSSNKTDDLQTIAIEEVLEETGFVIKRERLKSLGSRQMCATLSAHKSNLYSVKLTEDELKWFKSQKDIVHGNKEDSERTFIEVYTVKDLLNNENIDWSCLGQIFSAYNFINH